MMNSGGHQHLVSCLETLQKALKGWYILCVRCGRCLTVTYGGNSPLSRSEAIACTSRCVRGAHVSINMLLSCDSVSVKIACVIFILIART